MRTNLTECLILRRAPEIAGCGGGGASKDPRSCSSLGANKREPGREAWPRRMPFEPLKRRGGRAAMLQDGQERLLEADEWLPQSELSDSFVVCLFVLLGCGLLLPWNALITGESIIRL